MPAPLWRGDVPARIARRHLSPHPPRQDAPAAAGGPAAGAPARAVRPARPAVPADGALRHRNRPPLGGYPGEHDRDAAGPRGPHAASRPLITAAGAPARPAGLATPWAARTGSPGPHRTPPAPE